MSSAWKRREPEEEDFSAKDNLGHYGGHHTKFPQPLVWYWPKGRRLRNVSCRAFSWVGTAAGAKHWYARVEEESNHAWNGHHWACPWGVDMLEEGRGRKFDKSFLTEDAAVIWINKILKKHFSVETHRVTYQIQPPKGKYLLYTVDGD